MRDLERELAALRAENEALNTEKRVLEMNYKVWTQRALAAEAGLARLKAAQ